MKILEDVLRRNTAAIAVFAVLVCVNAAVFVLYGITKEPFVYSTVLASVVLAAAIVIGCLREKKRSEERLRSLSGIETDPFDLPEAKNTAERDYQEMIVRLGLKIRKMSDDFAARSEDAVDYYTTWVHQIKTPIAVMKLKLSDDTPENRALRPELNRIEQYVEMVLQYIRLGSDSNDLVIEEYPLDDIVREAIRKYALQFIEKKLSAEYEPTGKTVVTDRKWLSCILDQLISNAVKYTVSGKISISVTGNTLTVADTGIGIMPEDLPRIFEKGYTGQNGRIGRKSSGLGLYLAKKAAGLLNVTVLAESTPGNGSRFSVVFPDEAVR